MNQVESSSGVGSIAVSPESQPVMPAGLSVASQVMAMRSATRQDRIESARGEARGAETERQAQVDARLEAMRRAEEAHGDAGFWGKIADVMKIVALVATIVVGVAGSVFTGGASGVAAGVAFGLLTATVAAAPYAAELVADATNMSPEQRLGLTIGVGLVCLAAAFLNPGAAATSATNIATATARVGSGIANITAITQRLAQGVEIIARFTNGYSAVMAGCATIEEGDARADGQRHEARSTAAGHVRDEAVERLEDLSREAVQVARQIMRTVEIEDEMTQAAVRA